MGKGGSSIDDSTQHKDEDEVCCEPQAKPSQAKPRRDEARGGVEEACARAKALAI